MNHYPFNLDYNTEQAYPWKLQFLTKFWGVEEEFSFESSVLVSKIQDTMYYFI